MSDRVDALLVELLAQLGVPMVLDVVVGSPREVVGNYRPHALKK